MSGLTDTVLGEPHTGTSPYFTWTASFPGLFGTKETLEQEQNSLSVYLQLQHSLNESGFVIWSV